LWTSEFGRTGRITARKSCNWEAWTDTTTALNTAHQGTLINTFDLWSFDMTDRPSDAALPYPTFQLKVFYPSHMNSSGLWASVCLISEDVDIHRAKYCRVFLETSCRFTSSRDADCSRYFSPWWRFVCTLILRTDGDLSPRAEHRNCPKNFKIVETYWHDHSLESSRGVRSEGACTILVFNSNNWGNIICKQKNKSKKCSKQLTKTPLRHLESFWCI
jgi:hypothetical protein